MEETVYISITRRELNLLINLIADSSELTDLKKELQRVLKDKDEDADYTLSWDKRQEIADYVDRE